MSDGATVGKDGELVGSDGVSVGGSVGVYVGNDSFVDGDIDQLGVKVGKDGLAVGGSLGAYVGIVLGTLGVVVGVGDLLGVFNPP